MSKPIDAAQLSRLPADRCKHGFWTFFPSRSVYCKHPENIGGSGWEEFCTKKDWNKCPLNKEKNGKT